MNNYFSEKSDVRTIRIQHSEKESKLWKLVALSTM